MRLLLVFLVLIFKFPVVAQPGGGGGIEIGGYYDQYGKPIHNDPLLEVRIFRLKEISISSEMWETFKSNLFTLRNDNHRGTNCDDDNQRLMIVYKNDTMVLDVIGIIGENGAGIVHRLDRIVFMPGYHRYFQSEIRIHKMHQNPIEDEMSPESLQFYEKLKWNRDTSRYCPQPIPKDRLNAQGKVEVPDREEGDDHFTIMNDKLYPVFEYSPYLPKIPAQVDVPKEDFYIARGQSFESRKLYDLAIRDYHQAKDFQLLFWLYRRLNQPDSAIKYISLIVDDTTNISRTSLIYHRGEIFEQMGKVKEAVADYEVHCMNPHYRSQGDKHIIHAEELRFFILKDTIGAIEKLRTAIGMVPDYSNQFGFTFTLNPDLYFSLAQMELLLGRKTEAFKHIRMYAERTAGQTNYANHTIPLYIDSLRRYYKKNADLTFALAIATSHHRDSLHDYSNRHEITGLEYLKEAGKLGIEPYLIEYYKAIIYRRLSYREMEYMTKAIDAVDKSISLKPDFPMSYRERSEFRSHCGDLFTNEQIQQDWQKYLQLLPGWKFEEY